MARAAVDEPATSIAGALMVAPTSVGAAAVSTVLVGTFGPGVAWE